MYLEDLEGYDVNITKSPILKKLKEDLSKNGSKDVFLPIGLMRFYVFKKSPDLYQDIASQLHRFRLLRILFLANTLSIIAVIRQMLRGSSSLWILILGILIFIAHMDFIMIYDRFKRYCRSIERSYTILMLDQGQDTEREIISQTVSETDE
jgi:hypothetical protein